MAVPHSQGRTATAATAFSIHAPDTGGRSTAVTARLS